MRVSIIKLEDERLLFFTLKITVNVFAKQWTQTSINFSFSTVMVSNTGLALHPKNMLTTGPTIITFFKYCFFDVASSYTIYIRCPGVALNDSSSDSCSSARGIVACLWWMYILAIVLVCSACLVGFWGGGVCHIEIHIVEIPTIALFSFVWGLGVRVWTSISMLTLNIYTKGLL